MKRRKRMTDEKALEIYRLCCEGKLSNIEIAKIHKTTCRIVCDIKKGWTYTEVTKAQNRVTPEVQERKNLSSQRFRKRRSGQKIPCSVPSCKDTLTSHNKFCIRHANQIYRHGKTLKRTQRDLNDFRFKGRILYMDVYDGRSVKIAAIILDAEDYDKVKNDKWSYNQHSEQVYTRHPKYCSLKRKLLNIEFRRRVTFINGNKKDFRKNNLKVTPISENTLKKRE